MSSKTQRNLEKRLLSAAEAALADHQYVGAIDVLVGMGLLAPTHVDDWRKGRVPYLEQVIHGNLKKISRSMKIFRGWARTRGLKPSETVYLARTRGPRRELQFSVSGNPGIEKAYRTHYFSPELSEKKREKLRAKLGEPPEIVVFWILRDSQCSQCKTELPSGSFLLMEAGQPLCLTCADLDHLIYLPRGDTALTRRARQHSALSAVVVRFSRTRERYERQGILVQEAALSQAEEECLSDADLRAQRREREALRRRDEDKELVELMADKIRSIFPGCPPNEAHAIAEHTAAGCSGRVGRSAAGRALDEDALRLSVIASIRHHHTNCDELMMQGVDRASARQQVQEQIDQVVRAWQTSTGVDPYTLR